MDQKPTLLMVEDDLGLLEQFVWSFSDYNVVTAVDRKSAILQCRQHEPQVVTLDLGLPPDSSGVKEGLATLQEIRSLFPKTKIIMVTGQQDRNIAIQAISLGAYDYYTKPIDPETLKLILSRAFYLYQLERDHEKLSMASSHSQIEGFITSSPNMLKICQMLVKVAPTNATTLLIGESGTGKEILAKGLHVKSGRSHGSFVAINCAAIPETLLESELFGFEKGAFTGASQKTKGKIEMAHGGTLFLDEVGDLPLSLQPKLLRFLQEKVIERLGGRDQIAVDVRVVCATHQNLKELIKTKNFREDLFYRISEITLNIPPLRERKTDPLLLARVFLRRFSTELNFGVKGFMPDAILAITQYPWPGNVRELEHKIKRAVIMSEAAYIKAEDLDLPFNPENSIPLSLKQIRENAEKEAVLKALQIENNNLSKAASRLGITRPTLYSIMERLNLPDKAQIE